MGSKYPEKAAFLPMTVPATAGAQGAVMADIFSGFASLPMKIGDSDYLAWAVPAAIYQFSVYLFGAGGFWLFTLLLTGTLTGGAMYTTVLLMLASLLLAAMYQKMGLFWRRTDTGHDLTKYDYSHTLYTDLLRVAGYFLAGMCVVFALKAMCTQNGFLGDRVFVFLTAFLGLVFHVPFKLVFNDGEVYTVKDGGGVGPLWYSFEIIVATCFLLVISDLLVAADGSPLSGIVYWCCSVLLAYFLFNLIFKAVGFFGTSVDKPPFDRYTPALKAAIYFLHDILLFAFLIFTTAFAASGAPWSGLTPFLPPGTNSTAS